MQNMALSVRNLCVEVGGKLVIDRLCMDIPEGKIVGLAGRNGSGKSSLALALAGYPTCKVLSGAASFYGKDLLGIAPEERAKIGLFLGFQNPPSIPGVTIRAILLEASKSCFGSQFSLEDFDASLTKNIELLALPNDVGGRCLDGKFSGGERRRIELLQMLVLKSKLAILDEVDSGVDAEALERMVDAIQSFMSEDKSRSILIITHYQKTLEMLGVDEVFVMSNGRVEQSEVGNSGL